MFKKFVPFLPLSYFIGDCVKLYNVAKIVVEYVYIYMYFMDYAAALDHYVDSQHLISRLSVSVFHCPVHGGSQSGNIQLYIVL